MEFRLIIFAGLASRVSDLPIWLLQTLFDARLVYVEIKILFNYVELIMLVVMALFQRKLKET